MTDLTSTPMFSGSFAGQEPAQLEPSTMTHDDLVRRVYDARRQLILMGNPTRFQTGGWQIVMSSPDWVQVITDEKVGSVRSQIVHDGVRWTVCGIPITTDRTLKTGEVRLRAEVAA